MSTETATDGKRRRKVSKGVVILWIVVLALAVALAIVVGQNIALQSPAHQQQQNLNTNHALVEKVRKLILLPDEQPSIASIVDIAKLKEGNATFYQDAQNGDTLLIYSTKAVIYRESINQVINIAPVNIAPSPKGTSSTSNSNSSNSASNIDSNDTSNATSDNVTDLTNDTGNDTDGNLP
ncbi:MAG: hypothetical protein U0514_03645 [Candidatus Andersenbacteria bacterium]